MSWRDDLTLAKARLATLEEAELKLLTGQNVTRVMSDGDALEYGSPRATPDVLARAIADCRHVIRRLDGSAGGGGAIIPRFR